MQHIVIIGNGISGITAARHIRKKSQHRITVISAETDHFFSRTALMYIYMGHMTYEHTKPYEDWFWEKNRIELKRAFVEKVATQNRTLHFSNGESMSYDKLIIATGSRPNTFGWPGQDLEGVQGLYSYQDLESMEQFTKRIKRAVVVGGGLIGIEMAEMLCSRNIPVTFLVRESSFWNHVLPPEESAMINRHIREHHVDLRLSTELKAILPDTTGRARAVITHTGEEISCQFVGLTVGVSPNIAFLEGSAIETNRGVLVDPYLKTNIEDVYAIGDCAEFRKPVGQRRSIEQVWYTGRMMGETIAHSLCISETRYQPGNWFNSAKFFDIEYQTYGWVWAQPGENEQTFYWEDKGGKKSFRAVFNTDKHVLAGINAFGLRLRHEVCDRWISEKRKITYVMENLREANFDPEFFKNHEEEIIKQFNLQFPQQKASLKRHKKRFSLFR